VSSQAERFDEAARREFAEHGRTVVRPGTLLRHPVYTRVLHWTVAIFFVLSLLTGFAVYSPWLFRWLTPLFGGGLLLPVPQLVRADGLDGGRPPLAAPHQGVRNQQGEGRS
jgi:hypothetical protein